MTTAETAAPTVMLVRHAETDALGRCLSGRSEIPLNARGRATAHRLGRLLARHRPSRLVSSPTRRAAETAALLAHPLGLVAEVDHALDEIDFGAWSGRSFAELDPMPAWQRWNADRSRAAPPGGERAADLESRIGRWIDGLSAACAAGDPRGPTVAVSHADVIKAAIAHVLGLSLHFHARLEVAPGSVAVVELAPGGARLLALGLRG